MPLSDSSLSCRRPCSDSSFLTLYSLLHLIRFKDIQLVWMCNNDADCLHVYRADSGYVDCYTVASYGHLETRPWVHHYHTEVIADSKEDSGLTLAISTGDGGRVDSRDTTVMMELMRDIEFRQTDSVPGCISQPSRSSSLKYVVSHRTLPSLQLADTGRHNDCRPPHVPAKDRNVSVTTAVTTASSLTPHVSLSTTEHSTVNSEHGVHDRHQVTASDEPSTSLRCKENIEVATVSDEPSRSLRHEESIEVATANDEPSRSLRCEENIEVATAKDEPSRSLTDEENIEVATTSDEPSRSLGCEEQIADTTELLGADSYVDESVLKGLSNNMIDSCVNDRLRDSDSQCQSVSCSTVSSSLLSSLSCNGDDDDNDRPAVGSISQTAHSSSCWPGHSPTQQQHVVNKQHIVDTAADCGSEQHQSNDAAHDTATPTERLYSLVRKKTAHQQDQSGDSLVGGTGSENVKLSESVSQRSQLKETVGYDRPEMSCSHNNVDPSSCGNQYHQSFNGSLVTGPLCAGNDIQQLSLTAVKPPSLALSIAANARHSSHSNDVSVRLNCDDVTVSDAMMSSDAAAAVPASQCNVATNSRLMTRGSLLLVNPTTLVTSHTQPVGLNEHDCFMGTLLAYDAEGCAFYVPAIDMRLHGDPSCERWFFPVLLTPLQASILLSIRQTDGCFLVYRELPCGHSGVEYSLALCAGPDVLHYGIVRNVLGDLSILGHQHSFLSLSELVTYFQHNKSSLATRLGRPLSVAHLPVTAWPDYDGKYELVRSQLRLSGNIIGNGRFGVICVGKYRGQPVAIKVWSQLVSLSVSVCLSVSSDVSPWPWP